MPPVAMQGLQRGAKLAGDVGVVAQHLEQRGAGRVGERAGDGARSCNRRRA